MPLVLQLAERSSAAEAVDAMVALEDPRVAAVLHAASERNLALYDEQPVIIVAVVDDSGTEQQGLLSLNAPILAEVQELSTAIPPHTDGLIKDVSADDADDFSAEKSTKVDSLGSQSDRFI